MNYAVQVVTSSDCNSINLGIWIPAIISILTLIINITFYIFIAPKITSRYQRKDKMFEICSEFMSYLSNVVSLTSFSGVPTKIRNYCLQIHLMFLSGTAPDPLATQMENIFKMVQQRKDISEATEISEWETTYRDAVRSLREELSKYTGFFK